MDAVLLVRKKAVYLGVTFSEARPSVEAELRDIDAEEWSDVSAMCLNRNVSVGQS
nr:shikimate dehydrogenase [Streptococcus sanguinis]